jgi:hypothetical protein
LQIGHAKYGSGEDYYLNGSIAGLRIVNNNGLYSSNFTIPTSLPSAISGTVLLLNFGATTAPTVLHGNGAYTDGYYTNGIIDINYTCAVPQLTQDSSCYATYAAGIGSAANGAYADFLYENGYKQTNLCVYNGCMADGASRAWIYRGSCNGAGLNPMDIYTSEIPGGDNYCYPAVPLTCSACTYSNCGDANCVSYCLSSCCEFLCSSLPIIGGAFYPTLKNDLDHSSCLVLQTWSSCCSNTCSPLYDEYMTCTGNSVTSYYCTQYAINTFIFGSNGQPACYCYYHCEVDNGVILYDRSLDSTAYFMQTLCSYAPYMTCIS